MTQKNKIIIGIIVPIVLVLFTFYFTHFYFGLNCKLTFLFVEIVIFLSSILLIYNFKNQKIIDFRISKMELKNFFKIAIFSYVIALILQFVSGLTKFIFLEPLYEKVNKNFTFLILFMLFISPLGNELMFRGFLLNMIEPLKKHKINISENVKLTYSVMISGAISGSLFLLLLIFKTQYTTVIFSSVSSMIMGIIAGYYQEKYNNFTAPLIVNYSYALVSLIGVITSIIIS